MPPPWLRTVITLTLLAACTALAEPVRVWEFSDGDTMGWTATRDLRELSARDGALVFSTSDDDPGIILQPCDFTPSARHFVQLRVRASHTGNAQLFWFPQEGREFGEATFHIPKAGEWVDLAVFPGWGRDGPLRALRLDTYHFGDGCAFEVAHIALYEWPDATGQTAESPWVFVGPGANATLSDWLPTAHSDVFVSPPLDDTRTAPGGWAEVRARALRDCVLAVLWFDPATGRRGRLAFPVRGDGVSRPYWIQLSGDPRWSGRASMLGLEAPLSVRDSVSVEAIAFTDGPSGPPELAVRHLGFENGHNRAGRPCGVLATVENIGGSRSPATSVVLVEPPGLALVGDAPARADVPPLEPRQRAALRWEVVSVTEGSHAVALVQPGATAPLATAELSFLPVREVTPSAYVPEPRSVATDLDVFMFYFPGWESPARWAPIRSETPERKPLLGWYDEANPECVDWQIKWARENGITGFILDWYWNQGHQHLDHWLRAYRTARFRDHLKLFLLWCDPRGEDVGTPEDIRPIVRYWIDHVFSLPGYHRIAGRPVVAVFAPDGLRAALGGSEQVREAFDICRSMARDAGYPGIAFLSAGNNYPVRQADTLAAEGYWGATTYHEPGHDYHDCPSQQMRSYDKQVRTAPDKWRTALRGRPPLHYFPVVDSGWDSRPWHSYRGATVWGRTVALFEEWLRRGRDFCLQNDIPMLVLGPGNEWGEGSYLEPCTEFGFGMYEAVRRVLATDDPDTWPENLSPRDVGLGPYDLPETDPGLAWSFEDGLDGWTAGNGCTVEARDGALWITSLNDDPTLWRAADFRADTVNDLVIRLRCIGGTEKPNYAQLFWATEGDAVSGASVVGFLFEDSEEAREYRVPLSVHPRWRGRIIQLRFDPCCEPDLTVIVEEMRLQ